MSASGIGAREAVETEALFRAHAPFVARLLARLGVSAEDLDDAVQEVFLVVHRNGGYAPGPATPTGYLASIALRAASSHRRRGRKRRDRRSEVAPDEVSSTALDPARSLEVQQSLAELQGALDRLDPQLRATLVLAELEGESCGSIASTMNVAVGTVYWRLHRARKTFREAIESHRSLERRAGAAAAGALLFGGRAGDLLDTARAQRDVGFDPAAALARLREALRAGASNPPWAAQAARAGIASGVGLKASAVLAVAVLAHAIGTGVSRGSAGKTTPLRPDPDALVASIAPELPRAAPPLFGDLAPTGARDGSPAPSARADSTIVDDEARRAGGGPPRGVEVPGAPARTLGAHRAPAGVPPPARSGLALGPGSPADGLTAADPGAGMNLSAGAPPVTRDALSADATREMQEVAQAQRLVASDPARALSLVRSGEARFPSGYLREERRYVGVVALFNLGRLEEGRAEAARFRSDYPDGPFSARVRALR
jgi:RNA polymerase sigma-70 factor, ECF subfamily